MTLNCNFQLKLSRNFQPKISAQIFVAPPPAKINPVPQVAHFWGPSGVEFCLGINRRLSPFSPPPNSFKKGVENKGGGPLFRLGFAILIVIKTIWCCSQQVFPLRNACPKKGGNLYGGYIKNTSLPWEGSQWHHSGEIMLAKGKM